MANKKGGRPSFEGTIHTWKVPTDIEELFQKKGINWIWDAVRQYAKMEIIEKRYVLTPLGECRWELADAQYGISVTFVEGIFDTTQRVNTAKYTGSSKKITEILEQMCEYMADNYQDIALCNIPARISAIENTGTQTWFHMINALNGFWNDNKTNAKFVLSAELEDYFTHTPAPHEEERTVLNDINGYTEEEAKEVLAEVETFWQAETIPFVQWVKDVRGWHTYVDDNTAMKEKENKLYILTTERLKGYVKDNWRKRIDLRKGFYIDTLKHYNDDIEEVYDDYLEFVENNDDLEKRAQKFFHDLEEVLDNINNEESV